MQDSTTQILQTIWPQSSVECRSPTGVMLHASPSGAPHLRRFVQETLRRSRTSYSTLQVALFYIILLKKHIPRDDAALGDDRGKSAEVRPEVDALRCGRRVFLTALILASKYLQDRNFSTRAWSKISGLSSKEINRNEQTFLQTIDWQLHITGPKFQKWSAIISQHSSGPGGPPSASRSWALILPILTPELDHPDLCADIIPPLHSCRPKLSLETMIASSDGGDSSDSSSSASSPRSTLSPAGPSQLGKKPSYIDLMPSRPRMALLPTPPLSSRFHTPAASIALWVE